jgi:TolA-binding protein
MPEEQDITWERVAQIALWVLGAMVVGACSLVLTILIDQSNRISALETSAPLAAKALENTQNMNVWRIGQLEAQVASLKDDDEKMQRQLDNQQNWIDATIDADRAQRILRGKR